MKKVFMCLLTVSLLIMFGGCAQIEAPFDYLHSSDSIQKVEIVKLHLLESGEWEQTVLCVVDDVDTFIDDFEAVTCYIHDTGPLGIDDGDVAIKLIYDNGDYELVTQSGKATFSAGKVHRYEGRRVFDKEQFQALLDKYLSKAN